MIIKHLDDLLGTDAEVDGGTWISRRFLLRRDGMGFSLHDTIIKAGTETAIHYPHHLEAVYCVGGDGEIEDLATGAVHPLRDGSLYALDRHDRHIVRGGREDMRLVAVFNPPLTGREVHDEDGGFPLITEEDEAAAGAPA
ncbi:ectoine synthase [Roseospira visakhapatnamensis]|uniref:L-ectoine synthase n=1 Tax=Roseospira visakhapatnamensis TaxID=390880 RepID=A0A7W6R9L1_9PROT|nr:ectoine synthase [Roseospira visakhapatnamensis]MBB4264413.1 L-ectoine synthase [Roseospira visakhapatnamensis]